MWGPGHGAGWVSGPEHQTAFPRSHSVGPGKARTLFQEQQGSFYRSGPRKWRHKFRAGLLTRSCSVADQRKAGPPWAAAVGPTARADRKEQSGYVTPQTGFSFW